MTQCDEHRYRFYPTYIGSRTFLLSVRLSYIRRRRAGERHHPSGGNPPRSGVRLLPPVQEPRIPPALSKLSLRGAKRRGNLVQALPIELCRAEVCQRRV